MIMSTRHTAVDVGTPSNGLQEWEIIPVRFHEFEGLDTSRGARVESPEFKRFGHQWSLVIHPGGHSRDSNDGVVSVYLRNMSEKSVEVESGFTVKKTDGREVAACDGRIFKKQFTPCGSGAVTNCWGHPNFAKRSDIVSNLVAGALIIEVRMRRTDSSPLVTAPFVAENPFWSMMLKMFTDEESADVVFKVYDGDEQAHVKFHAHRLILKHCAPMLAELCGSGASSVQIPDVKPEIFRRLLHYVYGGKVRDEDLKSNSKEIIEAANRFGVVNLKLEAEASYVKSTTIGVGNVMEHLLYADAMNCALVKEAVMDFMVENRTEVLEKVSLNDAPGGLLADILAATSRKFDSAGGAGAGVDDFNVMRISDLRKKLHEKGLDADGSRETLIATLKENA